MAKKNDLKIITATGIEPSVLDALIGGARRNRLVLTKKQVYDGKRIRVRVDVIEPVRDLLRETASGLGTSVNDLGSMLLMYALARYFEGDPALDELLEESKSFSRSPRKEIEFSSDLVLERLQKAVVKAAKDAPSAEAAPDNGADNGANGWGDWLQA